MSKTSSAGELAKLRLTITESLRVQQQTESIEYINVGHALNDALARQNHAIFARRGCGKTLLLHQSSKGLPATAGAVYLNCEDFKRHSFPNVLIEILRSLFLELDKHLIGWFGRKQRSKQIVKLILARLSKLQAQDDERRDEIRTKESSNVSDEFRLEGAIGRGPIKLSGTAGSKSGASEEIEKTYAVYQDKLRELDHWLPELKREIRELIASSSNKTTIYLQIDDLYHLRRTDQAFVVDYVHRLCKDTPLYFKIATLRHASNLYADKQGQPIGAQERHDYQSINIDYTFSDFDRTRQQNWDILVAFAKLSDMNETQLDALFKGQGFDRLVMAGGGVPRDVLSLFLEVLGSLNVEKGERIGKDEVRLLSRANFERRIDELKQDSQDEEQGDLIKGIYLIRKFCLDRMTNVFTVSERALQENDDLKALLYRLMDYRIIHNCATALTHKSEPGTFQAFAIDIGCYAHLRKLQGRFNELDVSDRGAKEQMRSTPVLHTEELAKLFETIPPNVEEILLSDDE